MSCLLQLALCYLSPLLRGPATHMEIHVTGVWFKFHPTYFPFLVPLEFAGIQCLLSLSLPHLS